MNKVEERKKNHLHTTQTDREEGQRGKKRKKKKLLRELKIKQNLQFKMAFKRLYHRLNAVPFPFGMHMLARKLCCRVDFLCCFWIWHHNLRILFYRQRVFIGDAYGMNTGDSLNNQAILVITKRINSDISWFPNLFSVYEERKIQSRKKKKTEWRI